MAIGNPPVDVFDLIYSMNDVSMRRVRGSHRSVIVLCLNTPFEVVIRGVRICLDVHDVADTIQMLQNDISGCWPSKHGDTFQSIRLECE
jgi:hypothetical protein